MEPACESSEPTALVSIQTAQLEVGLDWAGMARFDTISWMYDLRGGLTSFVAEVPNRGVGRTARRGSRLSTSVLGVVVAVAVTPGRLMLTTFESSS